MGSLDVSWAKLQFFTLVDAISASHLPSFTIWLDAKLAEYKTIGQLKPDTEYESREQYPEWIGKALRQNLPHSRTSDTGSGEKRRKVNCYQTDRDEPKVPEDEFEIVVKEEPRENVLGDTHMSRTADTPLPGVTSTFSAAPELESNCALRQPAGVYFPTPSESHVTCSATSVTSYTAPHQPASNSVPGPIFSVSSEEIRNPMSQTLKSECASFQRESLPIFPPSVAQLESNPHLSASSPGGDSVAVPMSAAPPVTELVEGRWPPQTFSEEPLQARDSMARQGGSISPSGKSGGAASSRKPRAREGKPEERRHACTTCGAKFCRPSQVKEHQRKHTGERPYACSECPAKFTVTSNLKAHMRTHTGERPFACGECSATFSRSGNLQMHRRIHTGERPYVCGECPAKFTQHHHLKDHKRTHTGERPYACSDCPAKFHQTSQLRTHEKTHRKPT